MSAMLERGRTGLRGFRVLKVGLCPERKQLAQRINARVQRMFAEGLLDETRAMLARPDAARIKPLGALGYRQACGVLRGELTLKDAVHQTQAETRRYAKRQMTWFRCETDIEWFAGLATSRKFKAGCSPGYGKPCQPRRAQFWPPTATRLEACDGEP